MQPTAPNRCKAFRSKAVTHRSAALNGGEKSLESLPRERPFPIVGEQPAVQGPPHDGPRHPRHAAQLKGPVGSDGAQFIDPAFDRPIVLLEKFAGQRGPRRRIAARSPNPSGNHLQPQPVPEWAGLRVGGIVAPDGPGRPQRGRDRLFPQGHQGPKVNPSARHRMDRPRRRQARGAAAPRQPHEHGLRNVVLLVAEPERPNPASSHGSVEKGEAGRPRRRFGMRTSPGRARAGDDRHAERPAHP